ncbi:hypothetical protein HY030_02030 [Candidatus Gottesmanbacteria bacterium]|nr:hypothetical protein [Candidatus Gottesmanbacteria bacterium]
MEPNHAEFGKIATENNSRPGEPTEEKLRAAENTISVDSSSASEITKIRQKIDDEKQIENTTPPNTARKITRQPSFIRRVFDRFNYPSINDKRSALRVGYGILEALTLSYVVSNLAIGASMNGLIPPEIGFLSDSLHRIISLSLVPPLIASVAASYYIGLRKQINKYSYGSLLTVTKVASSAVGDLKSEIPELDQERFAGELHLIGKPSLRNPLSMFVPGVYFKSEFDNLREGLEGLSLLADACSNNNSELDGINVFYGVSPIVGKNLTRFGFRIIPYEDRRNLIERITDLPIDVINTVTSLPIRLKFKAYALQKSQTAVISREELVKNGSSIKNLLARVSRNYKS